MYPNQRCLQAKAKNTNESKQLKSESLEIKVNLDFWYRITVYFYLKHARIWAFLPPPRLSDSVTAGLQHAKRALVTHALQTAQRQLQHHWPLKRDKVTHVLQQEEARPVVVTVTQVTGDERILKDKEVEINILRSEIVCNERILKDQKVIKVPSGNVVITLQFVTNNFTCLKF